MESDRQLGNKTQLHPRPGLTESQHAHPYGGIVEDSGPPTASPRERLAGRRFPALHREGPSDSLGDSVFGVGEQKDRARVRQEFPGAMARDVVGQPCVERRRASSLRVWTESPWWPWGAQGSVTWNTGSEPLKRPGSWTQALLLHLKDQIPYRAPIEPRGHDQIPYRATRTVGEGKQLCQGQGHRSGVRLPGFKSSNSHSRAM